MNWKRLGLGVLFLAALLAVAAEPVAASNHADSITEELISSLNSKLLYVAVPIAILVEAILIYTVWRFRGTEEPSPTQENRRLEIIWTVATALILLFVGVAAYQVLGSPYVAQVPSDEEPGSDLGVKNQSLPGGTAPTEANAVEVEAKAFQWYWEMYYPSANVTKQNLLVVPANTPLYIHVTADRVIHSFHAPDLGLKQDAMPGEYNTIVTNITTPGSYQLYCAEFCGAGHSKMIANVTVLPQDEYQQWVEQQAGSGNGTAGGQNASGGNTSGGNASALVGQPS